MTITVDGHEDNELMMNGHTDSISNNASLSPDYNEIDDKVLPPLLDGSLDNSHSDILINLTENNINESTSSESSIHAKKSNSSPDIFDDSSPRNISRYGRTRKQKLIADFYVNGDNYPVKKNGIFEKSTEKSPSPKKKKSLTKDVVPDDAIVPFIAWNLSPNKSKMKVYTKKDMVQKKGKEKTATLMFNMFSPIKSQSPEKANASTPPLDIIVLKKSTKGQFECSPKSKSAVVALDFDSKENDDIPEKLLTINEIKVEKDTEMVCNNNTVVDEHELACGWTIGDLAWARVGSYPLWPCLVTRDAADCRYVKTKVYGRALNPSYVLHVTFFGDNGRHSWLLRHLLIKFEGLDDFNTKKCNITREMRKKDPKYCSGFDVKANKKDIWLTAVSEAEMLSRRPRELREEFLYSMFLPAKTPKRSKSDKNTPKVKVKTEEVPLSESLFDTLFTPIKGSTIKIEKEDSSPEASQNKNKKQTSMDKWLVKQKNDETKNELTDCSMSVFTDSVTTEVQSIDKNAISLIDAEELEKSVSNVVNNDSQTIEETIPASTPIKKRKRKTIENVKEVSQKSLESEKNDCGEVPSNCNYEDLGFQQFLENLRDEHPELEESKLLPYANEAWQYRDNEILSEMKNTNSVTFVKGLDEDSVPIPQPKRTRRTYNNEVSGSESPISNREKSSRKKSIQSYACEKNSSTDESDDDFLPSNDVKVKKEIKNLIKKEPGTVLGEAVLAESNAESVHIDVHMESLKCIKPNLFKGLSKEKVCEICELPSNLLKCKGSCQGMFHNTCVQLKYLEPIASKSNTTSIKRKKKKGRQRGKGSDSADSPKTDDNQDSDSVANGDSDSKSFSGKDIVEPLLNGQINIPPNPDDDCLSLSRTVDDIADFESQISQKMIELIKNDSSIQDLDASSTSFDDWRDVQAGQCVIVDAIKPKIIKPDPDAIKEAEIAFKCNNCSKNDIPLCFICKSEKNSKTGSDARQRCGVIHCHQYYHIECLKYWPQTKFSAGAIMKGNKVNTETFFCPRHVCHTCVSDDPQGCKSRFAGDKLTRCVKCPATYHTFTQCIPAGTKIITASQIVCPRHFNYKIGKIPQHVNAAWCFICAKGGMLVCCETCPTSFHAECLNVPLPEDGYICEDCETGRLPLYEELVWVKLGQYRWWPALVLHPADIPPNINGLPHHPGQFAVRFFGIYDHYWVNSGRVFPYQEGDTGHASSKKSSVDNAFLTAIKQAKEAYAIIKEMKEKAMDVELTSSLLPPKYVKLKINRAINGATAKINGESSKCDCNPNSENPCAPDTDCLNRMLLTECSPSICSAGERCCNQSFEKREYPLLEPSRTSSRGWGLKTSVDINKGQFVIEYVGEVIDEVEFQRRMKIKQQTRDENYYFLTLDKDRMIDAGPKGNVARFMNHSCEPNCETQKWTVNGDTRVGLFALTHIPAGSEITFNYNLACAGDDKKKCLCGARRCAGFIGAKPKQDEPVPKKPKNVKLKRKYRRKPNKTLVVKPIKPPKTLSQIKRSVARDIKGLSGIDKDVELIKRSMEYSKDGDITDNDSIKVLDMFKDLSAEIERYQNKTDEFKSSISPHQFSKKGKGVKRKRSFSKLHLKVKNDTSDNSACKIRRTRSNSVLTEEEKVEDCKVEDNNDTTVGEV